MAAPAPVIPIRPGADLTGALDRALAALDRHLNRCKLSPRTGRAYRRQCHQFADWLRQHAPQHPDALVDAIGAEGALTAYRRHLLETASPSTVNQALAAVTLLLQQIGLQVTVKRAKVARPGAPDALELDQQRAVERAARRRGARDAAIIGLLLYTGARAEECARLTLDDVPVTARTGEVRLLGKGDQVRTVPLPQVARQLLTTWLDERGREPGPLWWGQRGPMSVSGVTQVVLAVGRDAGIAGLRPHRLRHTYATRLRQSGADSAQIQALMGHASLDTTARYFRAGAGEQAAAVERAFDQ